MTSKEVLEYLRTCKFCKIVMGTDYENDDRYFNIYDVFREEIEIIQKDLDRLEIYEKFTIPNLKNLILKIYNNEELTREEHEIIFEIMSLKNEVLENE